MDAPTDEQLLAECVQGRSASFELLVRRYAQELHRFAARITGSAAAAEDVVQETFLQVHNSARTFDPGRRFKPWLFTIAANKARDYLRRRARRREVSFEAQTRFDDGGSQRFLDLLASDAWTPDDTLSRDEQREIVTSLVDDMPERLREVLVLAYFHRLAYREIGEVLGIPLGTVKSRLHAAVAWFAEKYQEVLAAQKAEDGSE